MAGLVYAVLLPSVMSLAVSVQLPAVLLVRLKVLVPEARAAVTRTLGLEEPQVPVA